MASAASRRAHHAGRKASAPATTALMRRDFPRGFHRNHAWALGECKASPDAPRCDETIQLDINSYKCQARINRPDMPSCGPPA